VAASTVQSAADHFMQAYQVTHEDPSGKTGNTRAAQGLCALKRTRGFNDEKLY